MKKKIITIGIIVFFICTAVIPQINAEISCTKKSEQNANTKYYLPGVGIEYPSWGSIYIFDRVDISGPFNPICILLKFLDISIYIDDEPLDRVEVVAFTPNVGFWIEEINLYIDNDLVDTYDCAGLEKDVIYHTFQDIDIGVGVHSLKVTTVDSIGQDNENVYKVRIIIV